MTHGTLLSVMWQPGWEGSLGEMDTWLWMAESLCCPPEIITTLVIYYTPIRNKKLRKEKLICYIRVYILKRNPVFSFIHVVFNTTPIILLLWRVFIPKVMILAFIFSWQHRGPKGQQVHTAADQEGRAGDLGRDAVEPGWTGQGQVAAGDQCRGGSMQDSSWGQLVPRGRTGQLRVQKRRSLCQGSSIHGK